MGMIRHWNVGNYLLRREGVGWEGKGGRRGKCGKRVCDIFT